MAVKYLDSKRIRGELGSAGSAELDGSNDYIDLGGSATTYNFLTAGSFSIACWIKITPAHDKILFDNMNDKTPSTNKGITYIIEGAGGSTYQITMKFSSGSSSSSLVTTAVWGDTDWQHFCSTYDGTTMKIYRNGTQVASGSITSNTEDQSYVPRIGWGTNGEKGKLTGNVSDFLITNDVLSATEISDLQTTAVSAVSPAISNQQVHYKFTENFTDSSGNSRNATATGSEISSSVYKFPKPDEKATLVTTEAVAIAGWTGCKNDACNSGAPTTVTISGGNLSAVSVDVATDDRMVKALGLTLSNTAWVCQFETNVSSTGTHSTLIGLVSSGGNMNNTSILCDYIATNKIIMREYNSGLTVMGSGISISTGTQYYVTVIRTALDGLTLQVRTGSHTGTLVGSESGTITGATSLTHVQSGAYGRGTGSATYDIDNIKIYNGVTTATGTPVYETTFGVSSDLPENTLFDETDTYKTFFLQSNAWVRSYVAPTLEDNFSTDNYTNSGSDIQVTGGVLDFTIPRDSTTRTCYRDLYALLGNAYVSNTDWTLRFKVNITDDASGGGSSHKKWFFGFSTESSGGWAENGNHLGWGMQCSSGSSERYIQMSWGDEEGYSANTVNMTTKVVTSGGNETLYYQLQRIDTTTLRATLYSDSDYSTVVETKDQTITAGDGENMRYMDFGPMDTTATNSGTIEGTIDDWKFYNGVVL